MAQDTQQPWYAPVQSFVDRTSTGFGNFLDNGARMQGLGTLIGGLGTAYGQYQQSKAAKEMLQLQKESFYDEKNRRNKTQLTLDDAFNTATPLIPSASLKLGA